MGIVGLAHALGWQPTSGSSQKHAIIREREHNFTFMSPARDQFARTTTRFCTRSLLIVVAEAPARRSRRIGSDKPFLAAHQGSANRVTLAKNIMTQLRWPSAITSHSFDNDNSIDIVGERRADRCEGRLARGGSIENRDQNHRIDPSTGAASICRRSYWPMWPTGTSIPSGHPFAGLYLPKARAAQSPHFKRSIA